MPQLMHIHIEYTLATASHGYILRAHMNERTHTTVVKMLCPQRRNTSYGIVDRVFTLCNVDCGPKYKEAGV